MPAPIYATDGQANAAFSSDLALTLTSTNEQPYVGVPELANAITASMGNSCLGHNKDENVVVSTLTARGPYSLGIPEVDGGQILPVAFGTTQVTSAANYSNPKPGDPCHPLAAGAHAPAIAFHPTQDPITSTDGITHAMGTGSKGGCATVAVAVAVTGDVFHTLRAEGFDASEDGTGRGAGAVAVAFPATLSNSGVDVEISPTLGAHNNGTNNPATLQGMAVRRLTPRECERLQGFPDDYTAIPWKRKPADQCPDGPRYKALGNSWAVPCAAWIGRRIALALADLRAMGRAA